MSTLSTLGRKITEATLCPRVSTSDQEAPDVTMQLIARSLYRPLVGLASNSHQSGVPSFRPRSKMRTRL